jgi:hypothetical protein
MPIRGRLILADAAARTESPRPWRAAGTKGPDGIRSPGWGDRRGGLPHAFVQTREPRAFADLVLGA